METKSRKTVYLIVFIAFAIVVLGVGAYAFYVNDIAFQDAEFNVNTTTAQESVFTASSSGTIAFKGTPKDVGQYSISTTPILTSNASIQVELSSSSDYETTQCTYDVVWNYTSSDMYTESDVELPHTTGLGTFPYELSIKINDNKEIDLSDFTWDNGKAIIMDDVVIASADLTKTTQVWDIVVNMYNIDAEQTKVFDKTFAANIEVVSNGCVANEVAENTVHAYYFDTLTNSYIALENVPYKGTLSTSKTMCVKGGTYTGTSIAGDECYAVYDIEGYVPGPDGSVLAIAVGDNLAEAIVAKGTNNLMSSDNTWGIINENGYRYEGDDPSNYVCFGSEATSCPADNVYRIIGAFNVEYDGNSDGTAETTGYLAKVQKNTMYGGSTMVYHSTYSSTTNSHYPNSEIYPVLNATWPDALNLTYQNQIASVNWSLGAVSSNSLPTGDFYTQERGTTLNTGVAESEKVFKVGMMYPSDYGYAVLASDCARTIALNAYNGTTNCYRLNWMHDAQQTMTAHINSYGSGVFYVDSGGTVGIDSVSNSKAVRPVFYLSADVKVTGGSGTSADPYRITL